MNNKDHRHSQDDDPDGRREKSAKMEREIGALKSDIARLYANDSDHGKKERDYWRDQIRASRWLNRITAGGVVAALATLVFLGAQVYVSRLQMRMEQRAWLTITIGEPTLKENEPISAPITLLDSGKTVAKKVEGFLFIVPVAATEAHPSFTAIPAQDRGFWIRESIRTGVIAPNSPLTMPVFAVTPTGEPQARTISPLILTPKLREEIDGQRTVLLIYGQVTYRDIFGDEHWYHFCAGHGAVSAPAVAACAAYNDTD
jgi:hypothetical protein